MDQKTFREKILSDPVADDRLVLEAASADEALQEMLFTARGVESSIEDLLAAAVNSAVAKVAEASKGSLSDLAGGITLPDGFKMPF